MSYDNGYGETVPDETSVLIYLDGDNKIDHVYTPLVGSWGDNLGAKIATTYTEMQYALRTWVKPANKQNYKIHTIDQVNHSFTYLDVGRWGGPALGKQQRCFGIIWGPWAALCEFVPNSSQNTDANYILANGKRADNRINDIIDGLRSANSSVHLIKSLWSTTPANVPGVTGIDWSTVYVILPDMHLPIIGTDPTTVTYNLPGGVMDAPWDGPRMGRFEYGNTSTQPGKYVCDSNDGAMKINAWFKAYHAGDIFGGPSGTAQADLVSFMNLLGKCSINSSIHFVQVGDMYDLWIGLECFFDQMSDPIVQLGDRMGIHAGDFIDFWVDRTNKVFPAMMSALGDTQFKKKSWLWGNHDNYLAAHTPSTVVGGQRIKEIRTGGVYIEHGQRCDSSNRDGETSGQGTTNSVFLNPVMRSFDPQRRDFYTTISTLSYLESPDFCVFAMGHTHSPYLSKVNIKFLKVA